MKALLLGSNGQLGQALAETAPNATDVVGADLPNLDITDAVAMLKMCANERPDVIINAAAYTAVDKAETEPNIASAVNVTGPQNIAAAANSIGARLIHISTDYVFDGKASSPYDPGANTRPLGVYGRTKRDGEIAVLEAMPDNAAIVRTAWLYGRTGSNFVKTMLRLMSERDELGIVADQRGTPTWADSMARAVWGLAAAPEISGIFHWTDGGECTWHDFAVAIQEEALSLGLLDRSIPIHQISTDDYPTAATRPCYSVLDCAATITVTGVQQAPWRDNLRRMLKGIDT